MDDIIRAMKKANRAAFRTREYAAMLGRKGYARLVLHRLKTKGELVSVKNGWWAFPDSVPEAVACEISNPAYISFHSALYLHGMTTQTPRKIQIAVARKTRSYSVFRIPVKEYKVKRDQFSYFYRKEGILLATPEKAFADSLAIPRACPEIVLIEAAGKIDREKVRGMLISASAKKRFRRLIIYADQKRS